MTHQTFLDGKIELYGGDNRDVLKMFPENHFSSIVCDPPYALVSIQKRFGGANAKPTKDGDVYSRASAGFMGKQWDTGEVAFSEVFWAECLRVLKPGGHVVAFSGTRTYHRMAVAIEDAGFEIRDQLAWAYGSGFPKSHDVSKAIDKAAGVEFTAKPASGVGFMGPDGPGGYNVTKNQLERTGEQTEAAREWQGWGTALKPAWEPICLARKPLAVPVDDIRDADVPAVRMRPATVAENVLEHGTGALNIDGCRVATDDVIHAPKSDPSKREGVVGRAMQATGGAERNNAAQAASVARTMELGRWPANIVHDGSEEVVAAFPEAPGQQRAVGPQHGAKDSVNVYGDYGPRDDFAPRLDSGSAARFFYTAKADKLDRIGSKHPTVKPVDLMQWLVRLVTPKGGLVLDPFAGSGSTGEAAWREGMRCILIEREEEYQADIAERLRLANAGPATRRAKAVKQAANDNLPLFGGVTDAPPPRPLKYGGRKSKFFVGEHH